MTKRVVLIGHPVAHSLSGAMQQAAFDSLGIDATYELWDRAPIELADAIAELRTDDFLGANVTIPHKERVVPMVDRLTEEAPRDRRGQHDHARGQAARRPQHRRARASRSRSTGWSASRRCRARPWSWAPAAARGPSSTASSPRASSGSSSSTATSTAPRAWSSTSAAAPRTWSCARCRGTSRSSRRSSPRPSVLVNATSIGLTERREPGPGRGPPRRTCWCSTSSTPRPGCCATPQPAGCTAADGELMLLHQGAAAFTLWTGQPAPLELMQREARRGARRRPPLGRGRADRRRADGGRPPRRRRLARTLGRVPLPDRRGIARAGARRHDRGRPGGPAADRGRARRRPGAPAARVRPRRAPGDRAGPRRDPRRRPPRAHARVADPAPRSATATGRTGRGSCRSAPLTDDEADELLAAADDGNKRATPVTRVRPGHADLAGALKYGFNDVRDVLERASARETAARVAAGGVARAFLRELGHRGLVVHGRGRRRGRRPGELHALARRGRRRRRCAARTPTRRRG